MDNKDKILVVIAARGGSKGVKDKNIREIFGKPLIGYTIEQAKKWGKADRIICSTDSLAIMNAARKYGAEIIFTRPAKLSTDSAGKIDVLRHALKSAESYYGEHYKIVVDLDVTAPVRTVADIDGACRLFIKERPKSVFSVVPCHKNPYFNMVEISCDGYAELVKIPNSIIKRRQDAPAVYDMNASIYVYSREYLMDETTKSAISDRSLAFVMDELSAFDIDREIDFCFLEYLLSKGLVRL